LIGHCVSPQPWREIDAHGLSKAKALGFNSTSLWKELHEFTVTINEKETCTAYCMWPGFLDVTAALA